MTLAPGDPRHGMNGYKNLHCRCKVCREANAAWTREWRMRQRAKAKTGEEPWHGTFGGYTNHSCRCEPCTKAALEYHRARGTTALREFEVDRAARQV